MDRTARMMRRTLLCAVFACPLAAWKISYALFLQAAWVCVLAGGASAPFLWARARRGFHTGPGRALFALGIALGVQALLHLPLSLPLFFFAAPALRVLISFTGVLLQSALIYRTRKAGRLHYAACLLSLCLFIVCMR